MNTWKEPYSAGLAIAFACLLSPIFAQSEELPARGPIPFSVYDQDANGLISKQEFDAVQAKRMATRADQGRPMRNATNMPSFSKFDTNGDGQLTRDELRAGQQVQMQQRREGMRQGGGMGMGQGRGMGQGKGMGTGRNMPSFADYDLNRDGKILEKEFDKARNKRVNERAQQGYPMKNMGNAPSFADIDANGDGQITPEEFATHQSQQRRQRMQ